MIELDENENEARLGANAIVGVSIAAARRSRSPPVFLSGEPQPIRCRPTATVPHFNVVNGGAHAPNKLDFQEFMIAPIGAPNMAEAVRAGAEVYAALRKLLWARALLLASATKAALHPRSTSPKRSSAFSSPPSSRPATGPGAMVSRSLSTRPRVSSTATAATTSARASLAMT